MKKLLIIMLSVSAIIAQDAAGQYKLSAVDVLYTFISRGETEVTVSDPYGLGVQQTILTIPAGVPFTDQAMQLNDQALSAIGINLNVTLNDDGTGAIAEGSYYPDVNTVEDENGNCVTVQQVLPVTDQFTYESMQNGMAAAGIAHPGVNVLGLPGISPLAGQQLGLLGLSGSLTFEDYPMIPSHPTLCDPSGTVCHPFTVGDIDGSGTLEIYPEENLLGIPEYVPGGAPLTGISGGFFLDDQCNDDGANCNTADLGSMYPGNTAPDFHLEWHGVDGASSGLGLGETDEDTGADLGDDDGDGTWWDRTLGIPYATATELSPACGFNYPIYGALADVLPVFEAAGLGACVGEETVATQAYLADPSGALATWGNFLTANGLAFQQCFALSGGDASACTAYMVDDSATDMDPSCLADGTLAGCSGRIPMNFDIPCVPILEAREVIAEFIAVGGGECGTGDMNADGGLNVLDVVALVQSVLGANGENWEFDCTGDMNEDGGLNVLDVVALVQTVLGGRVEQEASSVKFNVNGNEVTMTANGYVGAVEMTLSHGNDFTLELTDNAFVAEYITSGNTTKLIIVNPTGNSLLTANSNFTIESVIAASNSTSYLETSVNMLNDFRISSAYPNPFNPTTQVSLDLNTDANVSVKVFNTMGQLMDVLATGQMTQGSYSFTWDGANAASGVYLIQTTVGSEIHNQKIMLIK